MNKHKTVRLEQELSTVENYLLIEKIRFDDRLVYHFDIDNLVKHTQIPPMMLQTLAENAVKHGISKLKQGGEIRIRAFAVKDKLRIEIINTGKYEPVLNEDSTGLGLENTKERLRLLYEDKASFEINNLGENQVIALIEIPL